MSDLAIELDAPAVSGAGAESGIGDGLDLSRLAREFTGETPETPEAPPANATPVADESATPETPAADAPPAITEAEIATLREQAQTFERFAENFRRDPAGMLQHLLQGVPPEQRGQVLQGLAGQAPPPPQQQDGLVFEPESDVERDYLAQRERLVQLPEMVERIAQGASERLQVHQNYLHEASTRLEAQSVMIQALAEVVGMQLPEFDVNSAYEFQRQNPNATYADMVAGYKQKAVAAAEMVKQSRKPRPETPSGPNASPSSEPPKEVMGDLGALMRWMARNG